MDAVTSLSPEQLTALSRLWELEQAHGDDEGWLGAEWHEIGVAPHVLNRLVTLGLLRITYRSRRATHYRLADVQAAHQLLSGLEADTPVEWELPQDLFSIIEGHEQVKRVLKLSLLSPRPVHVLLHGPPASAKTLFLQEIARLPGVRYLLGGTTSRAGVVDYLLRETPRALLVDELDKMSPQDMSALLSVMETGYVVRMKVGREAQRRVALWVYAAANTLRGIPAELLSRFVLLSVPAYGEEDFRRVAKAVLTRRENVDPELAEVVVNALAKRTRDVRDAVKLARLVSSPQEAMELAAVIWPSPS
jgi:Holliday junction DNA helicase RuvB